MIVAAIHVNIDYLYKQAERRYPVSSFGSEPQSGRVHARFA